MLTEKILNSRLYIQLLFACFKYNTIAFLVFTQKFSLIEKSIKLFYLSKCIYQMLLFEFKIIGHLLCLNSRLKYYHVQAQQLKLLREVVYTLRVPLYELKRKFAF